jgi:hypothetical protein
MMVTVVPRCPLGREAYVPVPVSTSQVREAKPSRSLGELLLHDDYWGNRDVVVTCNVPEIGLDVCCDACSRSDQSSYGRASCVCCCVARAVGVVEQHLHSVQDTPAHTRWHPTPRRAWPEPVRRRLVR